MRAFLFAAVFAIVSRVLVQAAEPQAALAYKHIDGVFIHSVEATNSDGRCSVTVWTSTGNGASRYTRPLDAALLEKLITGLSKVEGIERSRVDAAAKDALKDAHYTVETKSSDKDGVKSLRLIVPEKDAPKAFLAWIKLVDDSLPKLKPQPAAALPAPP